MKVWVDNNNNHILVLYSSMDLFIVFYATNMVSFNFPYVLDVSDLSIGSVLCTFVVVLSKGYFVSEFRIKSESYHWIHV